MRHILLLAGLCATASAANAVSFVNGSFETTSFTPVKSALLLGGDVSSISGWKVIGTSVDIVDSATGGWNAASGVKSVDLNGISPGGVEQTLHLLTTGVAYQITFDLSGSYNQVRTAANLMSVSATGNTAQTYRYDVNNSPTNMSYELLTYNFTPTVSNPVIKFMGLNPGPYGAVLDNVGIQLAPVLGPPGGVGSAPEPAAWAMMLTGFGLVGVSARRRASARSVTA